MMGIIVPRTCVLFVAIIYTEILNSEGLITCEAGTFVVGEPAFITCKFRTNITATQRALNMALYPPDAPKGAIGKDILLCRWLTQQQSHQCHLDESNYSFDHVLTDRLTVKLPAVSYEQAGLYMCFFVPSDGTETHPCELTVVEGQDASDSGETRKDQNLLLIIIPSCAGALLLLACIVGIVIYKYRRRNASRKRDGEESQPMLPTTTIEKHLKPFHLTEQTMQQLMKTMNQEMKKGLDDSTGQEADIKMFPTFVTQLPNGSERGNALVLDLDDRQLKVSVVKLRGHTAKEKRQQYEMPVDNKGDNRGDAANKLFSFIANSTNNFIQTIEISGESLPLVFVVAFPCDTARLAKSTKDTTSKASVDQDLRNLLKKALTERKKEKRLTLSLLDYLNKLEVVAVVNDAAGTLMSVVHRDTNCRIGLTVGSGFNACFVQNCTHLETDNPKAEKTYEMIINTELGALGENGCLEFCRTEFDRELDEQSNSPGTQILEKMVGGRYIREMVRLVLEGLTKQSLLFHKVPLSCTLFQRSSLSIQDVVVIEDDKEEPYQNTREVLDKLGVQNYTDHDVETVRLVCRYVCDRAAFLTALGLATLINHVNQPEVTVVVDGDLYHRHPRFHDLMYNKTVELVKSGLKFYLVSPFRPRCVGAARIAARIAVAPPCQQPQHTVKGGNGQEKLSKKHPQVPSKEHSQGEHSTKHPQEITKEHLQEENSLKHSRKHSQEHIQAQGSPSVVT